MDHQVVPAQVRATRAEVVTAGRRLFTERGYA